MITALGLSLYLVIKYSIPWMLQKPDSELGWFARIAAWAILLAFIWTIFSHIIN